MSAEQRTKDEKLYATWSISLDTECPACKKDVDLLDYSDFWDGRKLELCEHHTDKSRNVKVTCPECNHRFVVDLEY